MSDGSERNFIEPTAPREELNQGTQAVVKTLGFLFISLRVLIVVVLFMFVFGAFFGFRNFGGFFHVDEHEQAMLFRFGRLVPVSVGGAPTEVFGSGELHWRWPMPVDELKVIETQRPVVVETRHFWPATSPNVIQGEIQASPEQGLVPGKDGYLLTGDTNIMHLAWTLTYRVDDPKKYYLRFNHQPVGELDQGAVVDIRSRGVEVTVKNLLEQAVLSVVGGWTVEEVWLRSRQADPVLDMTVDRRRELLAESVRDRVESMIADLDMGIIVQEVSLVDIQPPQSCAQAFAAVNDAAQEYQKLRDAAQTYRTRALADARSRAAVIVADSEAYSRSLVASAEADASVFKEILERYRESPESVIVSLYTETLREVLEKVPDKFILHGGDNEREIRLLLGPPMRRSKSAMDKASPEMN